MSKQKIIEAARMSLEGSTDTQIAGALRITESDLAAIRKTQSFKSTEKALARKLLEESEALLIGLAHLGLKRLREAMSVDLSNMDCSQGPGLQKRLADPALLKEIRLTTQLLYNLALDARTDDEESGESDTI